ncbi:prolyl oligopeptidase family serine peptidase [Mucilaginibacter sp. PAMB04274]|uniref:dienelactone hydrolase family protein n=1 Tax=Mucilaginibacter sp. PAMB04274 TaxID=3138568 RepID=UPI0031F68CA5
MNRFKALVGLALILITSAAFAQNYDEKLVTKYTLPDMLTTLNGKKVKRKDVWEHTRRLELLKLFEDNVYGQMPQDFDSIKYQITHLDNSAMGGKAVLKEIDIKVFRQQQSVGIHLVMFTPLHARQASPLFLLINNRGKNNMDPSRISKTEFWPAEQVIDSGYATAVFHVSDLAPDRKESYANGVLRLYPEQLKAPNGMKAIGAWAWGASRVMDYLQTDKSVDAKKVAIVGHSRGGKAALWLMAQDRRFAMCFASCSGNTGAALTRRRFGETIEKINTTFPYWFCDNYKKYNNNEDDLPVDQHMLIALSAPRPVYTTNATKDKWADPSGSYMAIKAAEPVYELYGIKSALDASLPPANKPALQPPLGYHLREGIHDLTAYDWDKFIRFAHNYYQKQ